MITPRLEMILRHVTGNSCADIGTDHGYVPIKLAERGMRVIATDIRPGPLRAAEENARKYRQNVELRLGGGLSPIEEGEADTIVIAGMGGEMISAILDEAPEKARSARLVLQPMNSQCELRKYLTENGYSVIEEDIATEGFKVYNLIVAESGAPTEYDTEIDFHLPKSLYSHPLFPELLAKKKRELTKIYRGLCAGKERNEEEIGKIGSLLEALAETEREVLN